ncbi:hypothetical protein ACHAXH_004270 [Discostella pseudostelligera]
MELFYRSVKSSSLSITFQSAACRSPPALFRSNSIITSTIVSHPHLRCSHHHYHLTSTGSCLGAETMRPLLPVISVVALNLKFDTTAAFHAAAASQHSDRCQSTIANTFNNHHHHQQQQQQQQHQQHPVWTISSALCATRGAPDGGEEEQQQQPDADNNEASVGFTALPPIGASSFRHHTHPGGENNTDDQPSKLESNNNNNNIILSEHTNLVSSKFQIQYTCKVCSTRNSHSVSRLAYRKGVVIAMCKGCLCRHLLADNLGWNNYAGGFNFDDGETNIEMYMENKARENGDDDEKKENDLVMRVNREVFDLEQVLYKGQGKDMISALGAMEGVDQQGDDENEMGWG